MPLLAQLNRETYEVGNEAEEMDRGTLVLPSGELCPLTAD